jgi:DNA-binding MarR family transcriptional regulator
MASKAPYRQHAVKQETAAATADAARTAEGDLFSLIVTQVMQLHGLLTMAGDAMAKPSGQTAARWWVLGVVGRAPSSVAQIARTLRLARQSVQRVADVLVEDGCAVYRANPRHRRAKLMQLTARGRSTLAGIQAVQRTWANAVGAEVGEANLRSGSAVLTGLLHALDNIHPEPR